MRCCSVVFGVTSRLFVINTSSSSPAINKLRRLLLSAMSVTNLARSGSIVLITYVGRSVNNTRRSEILVENSIFIPHLHYTPHQEAPRRNIAMTFGVVRLPNGEKFEDTVCSFWQNTRTVADGQKDGRTDTVWQHRPRLWSKIAMFHAPPALRQKHCGVRWLQCI